MKHAAKLIATLALLSLQNSASADVIQVSGIQTAYATNNVYWDLPYEVIRQAETGFPAMGSITAAVEASPAANSIDYWFYGTSSQAFFDWRFSLARAPIENSSSSSSGHLEFVVTEDTPYSVAGEYFHYGGIYEHEVELYVYLRDTTTAENIFVSAIWTNAYPEAYLAVGMTDAAITDFPVGSSAGLLLAGHRYFLISATRHWVRMTRAASAMATCTWCLACQNRARCC